MSNIATQFKKGQSGNPKGGIKKEWTMTGLIKDALEKQDEHGISAKVTIAEKLSAMAKRGDIIAIKEINNRIDGMPTQKTELTGAEGSAIEFNFTKTEIKDFEEFREILRLKELNETKNNT